MNLEQIKEKIFNTYSDQMFNYLKKEGENFQKKGDLKRNKIKNILDIENYQKEINMAFKEGIDDDIFNEKLKEVTKTGEIDKESYIIEKIVLKSDNGIIITTNVYKPKITGKRPTIFFVCGHSPEGKAFDDYQIVQIELVKAGFIVLSMDSFGQGERFSYYNKEKNSYDIGYCTQEHSYYGAKASFSGKTLYNYFIRDMNLCLDYLVSRDDVDENNIGMTGNSGGGTQTSYMMLLRDSRIKAFAPATFITDYMMLYETSEPQDDEQIVPGIIKKGFSYSDIIIAVAPKPVLLLGVNEDFFPVDGLIESYKKAKKIYKIYNKEDCIKIVIDSSKHKYTIGLAKNAVKFFAKYLMGIDNYEDLNCQYKLETWNNLNCFNDGQICLNGAKMPYEEIKEYFLKNYKKEKKLTKDFFYQKIFNNRYITYSNLQKKYHYKINNIDVNIFLLNPLKGIANIAAIYSKKNFKNQEKIIYLCDGGNEFVENNLNLIEKYLDDEKAVIVIDTSNYGYLKCKKRNNFEIYDFYGMNYFFANHQFFRDDSFAAFQCFEILSDLENLNKNLSNIKTIIASGLIENNLAVCGLFLHESFKFEFSNKNFSLKDIFEKVFYNEKDIKSIIFPGMIKYLDFIDIKKIISENKITVLDIR